MEVAVRNFVGDVSRFLDSSLSGGGGGCGAGSWEARCRWQLEQLRRQLQQLLLRYPSLRPAADETDDVTYDDTAVADPEYDDTVTADPEYDDTVTADPEYDDAGGAGETAQEAFYDDAGGLIEEDTYEEPSEQFAGSGEPQEEYDELGPALTGQTPGGYIQEPSYDDTAPLVAPYLPMGGKAARTLGIGEPRPPGKPTPSASLGSLSAVDPEVASLQSHTSQESQPADQVPAAQLCSAARRWGRLQLRQDAKLWSSQYRPYWAGLADGRLYLYRRETDAAQKRDINLSGYEVRQPPPGADVTAKRRPSCFELVKPGGHTHQLLALTPKDARQWMAALGAEGVLAGKSEQEPAEEAPRRRRPPAPPPGPDPALSVATATAAAAAAAATATLPLKGPTEPQPAEIIEEDLYNELDEESIYEDVSLVMGRQIQPSFDQANRVSIEEDIYEAVGAYPGGPPEPSWPAPVLPPSRLPPGRTGALPAVPGQQSSLSPESPVPPPLPNRAPLAPPSQPPPSPQRGPGGRSPAAAPEQQPPPPPQRGLAAPAQPPQPPQRNPASSAPAQPPLPPPARQERVPSPAPELIEEDLYDELADIGGLSALPPPSDPFYNVLEPEYLQPRHPSPVPIKAPEEPPDEGYGNSSGGSENDCHPPPQESHYKTLPRQLRPVRPAGSASSITTRTAEKEKSNTPATTTAENSNTPPPSTTENSGTPPPPTTENSSTPAPSTAGAVRPTRPAQLPTAPRPRIGAAGPVSGGGTGGVADVIRRLNRQSVGDEEPAASRPGPRQPSGPVSSELARKQALIVGGVRALSPVGKPAKPIAIPPKPAVAAGKPKPAAAAGKPKPKPALPTRQEVKPAGYGMTGGAGTRPAAPLVPNKSAVYKTMQRMSDSENRAASVAGQRANTAQVVTIEPEEEEVYAEIDDDSWRT